MTTLNEARRALLEIDAELPPFSYLAQVHQRIAIIRDYLDSQVPLTVADPHCPGTRITSEQFHALYGCRQPQAEIIRAAVPAPTPNPVHDQVRAEVRAMHTFTPVTFKKVVPTLGLGDTDA